MPSIVTLEHQPLEAPLNNKAKLALRELANKRLESYGLSKHLDKAKEYLETNVGIINERAREERVRHEKRLAKLAANDEDEDVEARQNFDAFQTRVDELTKSMDQSIRAIVDTRVWIEELPDSLKQVSNKASNATQATQRATQRSTQLPIQDATPRPRDIDSGNEDGEDAGPEDEDESQRLEAPPYEDTPSALLHAALAAQKMKWDAKTLTERYAHDNDYVGFYSTRFNAQNSGENPPPIPSATIWFVAEEGRNGPTGSGDEEEEDSDIEVAAERVSLKCPITLLTFEDPVSNSKCKHSFEKTAILNMMRNPTLTTTQEADLEMIRNRNQRLIREKQMLDSLRGSVKCPECRTFFSEADLKPNAMLKKRVQQAREAAERKEKAENAQEDDSEEEDAPRGTQRRPFGLGSSPMGSSQRRRTSLFGKMEGNRTKERQPVGEKVPETQADGPPGGTQMINQGDVVFDLAESGDELS